MHTQNSAEMTEKNEKIIEKNGRRYREVPRKSALPFWSAAAVWLIAALLLPMYSMLHLALIALASLIAGLLCAKFAPRGTQLVEIPFYEGKSDLNSAAGEIADAREALLAARDKIAPAKPETAARLTEIESICGKIQAAVLASPDDLPKLRRFLNYYLPTTRKLAEKYVLVTAHDGGGTNTADTLSSIEQALAAIQSSFANQLDALFSDDALDISTDITVLETLLARDDLK